MKNRIILHCDLNAFFASVECLINPSLNDVPMAVCGDPEQRHGIILAKNEHAKKFGIQTAETIWQAKRKCPNLLLVSPHSDEYGKYSKLVNEIYERFTDQVEPFGIDESWLDVTGSMTLFGDGKTIADTIRKTVREELGLTISVGVSFNKIFAKLGSDYKKPDATTVIMPEDVEEIVFPLPVSSLLYVGKASVNTLLKLGIKTIGQLANYDKEILIKRLGTMGAQIHDYANGKDFSPVASAYAKREVKSIGNGTTFSYDISSVSDIRKNITMLCDSVGTRLRKRNLKCQTVQITIKDPQFKVIQRQKQLVQATNSTKELINTSMEIIEEKWQKGNPIRMLTVTASKLIDENEHTEQVTLFDFESDEVKKSEKIDEAIDKIREKYGKKAVKFGANLENL